MQLFIHIYTTYFTIKKGPVKALICNTDLKSVLQLKSMHLEIQRFLSNQRNQMNIFL
jgi:hypothetical protein